MPPESFAAEEGSLADAPLSRAAEHEPAREPAPAPVREIHSERTGEFAATSEPKHVYTQTAAPVAFKTVIQHDDAEGEEAHRPQRKRRHGTDEAGQPQQLQIVETQVEAAPVMEDDLPRRTKPRRRRSGAVEAEPLKLVETQPNAESSPTP